MEYAILLLNSLLNDYVSNSMFNVQIMASLHVETGDSTTSAGPLVHVRVGFSFWPSKDFFPV